MTGFDMFLEYNWTACCYQARFGDTFTDIRGERSWNSFNEAKAAIEAAGLKIGRKTDSRTWEIV
jgi:hypothetical protein